MTREGGSPSVRPQQKNAHSEKAVRVLLIQYHRNPYGNARVFRKRGQSGKII